MGTATLTSVFILTLALTNFPGSVALDKVPARHFKQAELVEYLNNSTFDFIKDDLAMWMCMFCREANYYTGAHQEEYGNYGFFQIQSENWCENGWKGGRCNADCNDFLDGDLTDDMECAQYIIQEQGLSAWGSYKWHCHQFEGKGADSDEGRTFVEPCSPSEDVQYNEGSFACPGCSNSHCYGSKTSKVPYFDKICPYTKSELSKA
ncbi:hypothetical protein TCAL_09791 [Tigriopus californicus]|uniref:lysozyme n=1 Tax=Tigriopus californicus TaxID=6832 RepID=A0A553PQU8_TIGCA|nr:lysozyme C-1-like [Tigriopus californicus]TRY80046.1 hypothetical protein TCAL_09791 [Tigriopus californicus]|eukprot:TCALIF_09791-PA protein Name:"Similar to AGAP007347 Lysozyme c-1 (Anopheles gambiae)" AED:0.09 eAED:0.09 QI:105/1/1/1/1/1/3/92/205